MTETIRIDPLCPCAAPPGPLIGREIATRVTVYHELMRRKVREILLVATPFDAFIMEEGGSLAVRIINEYHGLNLSAPPRLTRVSSAREALEAIDRQGFDLVITMPFIGDMDALRLASRIRGEHPDLPVVLLSRDAQNLRLFHDGLGESGIGSVYVWTGDSDLLLAIVKNIEDHWNVQHDTATARVRVLLLVEDSPRDRSRLLPLLYKEMVRQTQAEFHDSLTPEHRLLKMRARPKILTATSHEEAMRLLQRFRPYVFAVLADARLPRAGHQDEEAGVRFLRHLRGRNPDLPLLLMSSDAVHRPRAEELAAAFADKVAPDFCDMIRSFFRNNLGFGDFVFRLPDGREIDRAASLADFEERVGRVPEESLAYHASRNHFSHWFMARSEIGLASRLTDLAMENLGTPGALRSFLANAVRQLRICRQRGIVTRFQAHDFDPEVMDFVTIGEGSIGGKARGLAFMSSMLADDHDLCRRHHPISIGIPRTCVLASSGFFDFVDANHLAAWRGRPDSDILAAFLAAPLPEWLRRDLEAFLTRVRSPLAVRSSSLLEDAHFTPFAGLYRTWMLPNRHPDQSVRLAELERAVKEVYASSFFAGPVHYARNVGQADREGMAVIVQELSGRACGDLFYPSISGVAQSRNFYPVEGMRPDEGISFIALGFGRTVVEGGQCVRFSPVYPKVLPQFATVEDTLRNSQRSFYALPLGGQGGEEAGLVRRQLSEAWDEWPVQALASTYLPEENHIRDSAGPGLKVLTFAPILKHRLFDLSGLLVDLLEIGRRGLGCPVEMEFTFNLPDPATGGVPEFHFLQLRPMAAGLDRLDASISREEWRQALCRSSLALGHGQHDTLQDIVVVHPERFVLRQTRQIAREIGQLNAMLAAQKRPYLLIGPGRWGSADPLLGIPVQWPDISQAGAMVELRNDQIRAEASQGTHFFQNITSLGIPYFTVDEADPRESFLDWTWLLGCPTEQEGTYLRHIRLKAPLKIRLDGKASRGVILAEGEEVASPTTPPSRWKERG